MLSPRVRNRSIVVLLAVAVIAVGGRWVYKELHWKRFAVVKENQVYRSGRLSGRQLHRAIDSLSLKTVVSLAADGSSDERELCESRGVKLVEFSLHPDGTGPVNDYLEVLGVLMSPDSHPVLVHCEAGVARTGAAIAVYRMAHDGWSMEEAVAELRTFEKQGRCSEALAHQILQVAQARASAPLAR